MGKEEELKENQLVQMEEMIEEVFDLHKDDFDLKYLGTLLDDYKKMGGDSRKYQERFANELNT